MTTSESSTPMTPAQAAEFLNRQVAWEPGLTVGAAVSGLDAWKVVVLFTRKVQDSSVILPDGTYPEPGPARQYVPAVHLVPVSMTRSFSGSQLASREVLLYHVICAIGDMHLHDIREFTKVRTGTGKWTAPFHPHRADGDLLWTYVRRLPEKEKKRELRAVVP